VTSSPPGIKARVRWGAQWCDRFAAGWYGWVDPSTFDMLGNGTDPLCQVLRIEDFGEAVLAASDMDPMFEAGVLGFVCAGPTTGSAALAWRREAMDRMLSLPGAAT
jgi:hypothetical protein